MSEIKLILRILTESQGKDRIVMHKQAAVASAMTNPGKVIDQDKRIKANRNVPTTNELSKPVDLRPEALTVLQAVAMSFLESSFNRKPWSPVSRNKVYQANILPFLNLSLAFLSSLLSDIRMQRAKIKEVDNTRFLFLSRFFLEYFLHLYAYERSQDIDPTAEEAHDFDLIAEMTEPASIALVCIRMTNALKEQVGPAKKLCCTTDKVLSANQSRVYQPPLWTELHAGVDCFTQLVSLPTCDAD